MKQKTFLHISVSPYEGKKLICGAFIFICCFFFGNVLKSYLGPLPLVELELSMATGLRMLVSTEEMSKKRSYLDMESINPIIRNFSNSRSDAYELYGDIRIHGTSSTIFFSSTGETTSSTSLNPYARKEDRTAMGKVRNLKIINSMATGTIPPCSQNISIPAIVFSTGGYAGNHFHDFTDVLIPLYMTSRQFNGTTLFLITDKHSWWTTKYKILLDKLSKYGVVDMDNEAKVLCFSTVIVGLKANKEFGIDPLLSPNYSTRNFTEFLRTTYSLPRNLVNDCHENCKNSRPRMFIISRKKTRHLRNVDELANIARRMGFIVAVKEMERNVLLAAKLVNSFDVMIGVHGAGLTNMVFLPENAIVIQIIPLGLDVLAKDYFQLPAKDMNLRYLEYKVSLNESSLLGKYPPDSEVYKDPSGILEKGFLRFRQLYLDNQDINLDLDRFKETLSTALELLRA